MCGIYCIASRRSDRRVSPDARARLVHRGPDSCEEHRVSLPDIEGDGVTHLTFISSVLCLRGDRLMKQPLADDETSNVLCWNGEAWQIGAAKVNSNDGQLMLQLLCEACMPSLSAADAQQNVIKLLSSVRGPFAMVFLDHRRRTLYFLRDCLGRRSLLSTITPDGDLVLASVSDPSMPSAWPEVEADGLYIIDLDENAKSPHQNSWTRRQISPRSHDPHIPQSSNELILPFTGLNKSLPTEDQLRDVDLINAVHDLQIILLQSLNLRITQIRDPKVATTSAHIAILFSGGIDCTLLVRLAHDILPPDESIDLINVAFENPRIHKDPSKVPYEQCPDRQTAKSSLRELTAACPGRKLRLICVDIPYVETEAHRQIIIELMHPHNTEMDFSITCALYFASRGIGTDPETGHECSTSARVLLSGLGADELFGGYQRHALAFSRTGFSDLIEELDLDFSRLGKRNLGRDDRVLSHWGRETRFPYLDENLVAWALQTPIWLKTGFGHAPPSSSSEYSSELEPGKLVLRQMALNLGLPGVARERKRAIQFGSRTAKMQSGRTKGTHVLS